MKTLSRRLEAVEAFLGRLERAWGLVRKGAVVPLEEERGLFLVHGSRPYVVDLQEGSCTCPDWARGHACKHLMAAYLVARPREKAGEEGVRL